MGPYSTGDWTSPAWDCLDRAGHPVPEGTYTVHVEITFDDGGHPVLPVHTYSATIDIGPTDQTATLSPSDAKVSVATVTYNAP
jgi:hypothetical protein